MATGVNARRWRIQRCTPLLPGLNASLGTDDDVAGQLVTGLGWTKQRQAVVGVLCRLAMAELKQRYDYIILDTPPVGLVSDAVELSQYSDVTLYIMRQNYTKKDMITLLNNRQKRGELSNVSIVFNGYENKAKYGAGYGYGYGYGTSKVKKTEILMIPRSEDEPEERAAAEESEA